MTGHYAVDAADEDGYGNVICGLCGTLWPCPTVAEVERLTAENSNLIASTNYWREQFYALTDTEETP